MKLGLGYPVTLVRGKASLEKTGAPDLLESGAQRGGKRHVFKAKELFSKGQTILSGSIEFNRSKKETGQVFLPAPKLSDFIPISPWPLATPSMASLLNPNLIFESPPPHSLVPICHS